MFTICSNLISQRAVKARIIANCTDFVIEFFYVNGFLAYRIFNLNLGHLKIYWILFILTLEIFSGIAMFYIDFPFGSQTLHLVLAAILFGVQFYLVLDAIKPKTNLKTS